MDVAIISTVLSSLKSAGDISKSILDLKVSVEIQERVIELQRQILDAQESALATQQLQSELMQSNKDFEEKIRALKAWGTERERYILIEVARGAFAYALKDLSQLDGANHWLCATCFQDGNKSILQRAGHSQSDRRERPFYCPSCDSKIMVPWNLVPHQPNADEK